MYSVKSCFQKFHKIHKKTPVLDCLFNKLVGLLLATSKKKKKLQQKYLPVNFVKLFKTASIITYFRGRNFREIKKSQNV